ARRSSSRSMPAWRRHEGVCGAADFGLRIEGQALANPQSEIRRSAIDEMTNAEIARRFNRLALLMEIRGEDKFRVRSYRNAAEMIETWPTPVERIAREEGVRGLQTIPGVGKAISAKIVELLERGTFEAWERLTAETPAS